MERGKGLRLWSVVLWTLLLLQLQLHGVMSSKRQSKACVPSRCGKITNITYPFRLRHDPANCGDKKYELDCENNVTVLPLYSGRYHVVGINYSTFSVRLVDPGIREGDCSSLPRFFLSQSNFSDTYIDPYGPIPRKGSGNKNIMSHVIYLNCSDSVRNDAAYVDTSPCLNYHARGHYYAHLGDLLVRDLKPQCRVMFVATITSARASFLHTYADIHRVLSYGFEVSWWKRACVDFPCPINNPCFFDVDIEALQCTPSFCYTPMLINDDGVCRNYSKPRIFAEDFLYGIYKGWRQILGEKTSHVYTTYDFSQTQLAIDLGVGTGRVVLPYIAVRTLFGITFLLALLIYTYRRRHLSIYEDIEDFLKLHNLIPIRYSYRELKKMTRGFKIKLGEGGFGTVYKGKLSSGPDVAIKMLGKSKTNGQEFISEVATIGRIHHFNVVRLVGFCVEGKHRALVYEFMPNGSLDKYIFSKEGSVPLSYDKIYEISLGVAQGIAYLHHGCDMQILHFDIKPHNILLDDNFIPKISDFGLARLYPVDDSIVTLTAARGTIGYMAPELFYKNIGGVSDKADVYSFGMLLMEMTSRRRNLNTQAEHSSQLYFPLWIYDQFNEEKDIEMEDLTKEEKELSKKMFIVALWCIQLKPLDRPSMNKVVKMLEADFESLEMPPKPSLYPDETVIQDDGSNFNQTISIDSTYSSNSNSLGDINANAGE